MSFRDKINQKKQSKIIKYELENKGLSLSSISYKTGGLKDSRIFLCLVRAVLIFFASFGTICATVSAFNAPFNLTLVLIPSLIICFLIAFIYYNKITFYVGYIIFFIIFSFGIFSLYIYVNSGFQAFMNILYEKYSDYFKLKSLRSATEIVTNRTLTISIAMIFVIAFLSLLLNITISGYMSLIETFLITFPLLQLPLYINITPKLIYLAMVLGSYIAIAILGRSSHHKIPDIGKKTTDFVHTGKMPNRYHSYIADGNSMLINMSYSIVLSLIILLMSSFFLYSDNEIIVTNKLKDTTDAYIKAYMQNGVWGLFDRYQSKGGLNEGQLGGVSSIHPDFQTDLKVTFVPQTANAIYLKGFVGTVYSANSFTSNNALNREKQDSYYYGITETYPYAENYSSKMEIQNIDVEDSHYYMPYYSGELISETASSEGNSYEIKFSPYKDLHVLTGSSNPPSKEYEEYVYETYLNVPENITDTLMDTLSEAGIDKNKYLKASKSEKKECALEIAQNIRNNFVKNYSYTMAPGSTPPREDFVEYFLSTQKRGFCAHFASSSTLLLRSMGIPARYVEGYMFSLSETSNITAVSDDITDWIDNKDNIELANTGLIEVDVNDSSAHAWTEIYLDGYGWIPYDFTPPSYDNEPISDFNFSSLFGSLFLSIPENNDNDNDVSESHFSFDFGRTFGFSIIPMLIFLGVMILVIIIYNLRPVIVSNIKHKNALKNENYNTALKIYYNKVLSYICKKNKAAKIMTVKDFISFAENLEYFDIKPNKEILSETIDTALYSQHNISQDEYKACIAELTLIQNCFKKTLKQQKANKANMSNAKRQFTHS